MERPRDCQPKRSKSERERQTPYDVTYTWNLKYDTNESACEENQTQIQRTDCGSQVGGDCRTEVLGVCD